MQTNIQIIWNGSNKGFLNDNWEWLNNKYSICKVAMVILSNTKGQTYLLCWVSSNFIDILQWLSTQHYFPKVPLCHYSQYYAQTPKNEHMCIMKCLSSICKHRWNDHWYGQWGGLFQVCKGLTNFQIGNEY